MPWTTSYTGRFLRTFLYFGFNQDESGGRVIGSSFLDERGPVFAIGPVSVDPNAQDHHVGRKLMEAMLARFHERGAAGVRLVQIAYRDQRPARIGDFGPYVEAAAGRSIATKLVLMARAASVTVQANERRSTRRPPWVF